MNNMFIKAHITLSADKIWSFDWASFSLFQPNKKGSTQMTHIQEQNIKKIMLGMSLKYTLVTKSTVHDLFNVHKNHIPFKLW